MAFLLSDALSTMTKCVGERLYRPRAQSPARHRWPTFRVHPAMPSLLLSSSSFASASLWSFVPIFGVNDTPRFCLGRFKRLVKDLPDISNVHELHLIVQFFGQVFHQIQLVLLGQDNCRNA